MTRVFQEKLQECAQLRARKFSAQHSSTSEDAALCAKERGGYYYGVL